jgi:hypothetical protein
MVVTSTSYAHRQAAEVYRLNSTQPARSPSTAAVPAQKGPVHKRDTANFSPEALDRLRHLRQREMEDALAEKRVAQERDAKLEKSLRTLEIDGNASLAEIKQAYLYAIQQYHPDKHANLPAEFRKLAELKAKEITEAYDILVKRKTGQQGA